MALNNNETLSTDNASAQTSALAWLAPTLPVALIALFAELGYGILNNSTLPVYFKDGLGIDPALIGPIMMPFFMSELLKGPLGVLADKIGRKPLIVCGCSVSIFTSLIITLIRYPTGTANIPLLVGFGFLRLLDGLGASALWPAIFAYLGDVVKAEKRASAMSVLNVTYMAGLALGFLAGGYADDTFGSRVNLAARYYPSFYLTSFLFVLAALSALIGIRKTISVSHDGSDAQTKMTWKSIKETIGSVPGVLLLAFVTFFGIGCIALQVKIFALDEFGITETRFGILFLWPALLIGALAIPLGHLADKWGQVKSIRLGFFVAAVSMWSMILLFRNPHVRELSLVIAGTLLGIGFVIAFPAWLAYLTTLTDERHRGTVIGAASTAQAIGVLLGVLLGGWLYKHGSDNVRYSHVMPFVMSAIFLTIGALLTVSILKKNHPGEQFIQI